MTDRLWVANCSNFDISLYIKLGKVSVHSSVTLGVASSVVNDVIMRTGAASTVGVRERRLQAP